MLTKYCPSCSEENVVKAKYCMHCREEFPHIEVKASKSPVSRPTPTLTKSPSAPAPKKLMALEFEYGEDEDLDAGTEGEIGQVENGEILATSMVDYLQKTGKIQGKGGGVKIEEVLGTAAGSKKVRRKPDKSFKNGKQILESTKNRPDADE